MAGEPPTCSVCGEIIGVYEPLVLMLPDAAVRRTSRAVERALPAGGVALHQGCYKDSGAAANEPASPPV